MLRTALLQAEEVAREQAAQSLKALQGEFEEAKVRRSASHSAFVACVFQVVQLVKAPAGRV